MSEGDKQRAYAERVRKVTERYALELLVENERLRDATATLEAEARRLEEELATNGRTASDETIRARCARLETARGRIEQILSAQPNEEEKLKRSWLYQRLTEMERENRRYAGQYHTLIQQSANLANLYLASCRLHGTFVPQEVLTAIYEVVVNFVGSEEMVIFRLDPETGGIHVEKAFGMPAALFASVRAGKGVIGAVAASGEPYFSGAVAPRPSQPYEANLTACVPLRCGGESLGVIAIFRLLEQKAMLSEADRELLDLLGTHAATALHAAELHQRHSTQRRAAAQEVSA